MICEGSLHNRVTQLGGTRPHCEDHGIWVISPRMLKKVKDSISFFETAKGDILMSTATAD